jgi:hypothetical protein
MKMQESDSMLLKIMVLTIPDYAWVRVSSRIGSRLQKLDALRGFLTLKYLVKGWLTLAHDSCIPEHFALMT